jgi:hypothetical protein
MLTHKEKKRMKQIKRLLLIIILIPVVHVSAWADLPSKEQYSDHETKGPWVDVKAFPSLAAAVGSNTTENKEILITEKLPVNASLTIPNNRTLRFTRGGKLIVASGKTLTIDCPVIADLKQQIFDGQGAIKFGWNSDQRVSICWKGATSEINNNAPFIQWALDQMSAIQGTVIIPFGSYKYTTPLKILSNTIIEGQGRKFSCTLHPIDCPAVIMDGSSVDGGWIFRIKIKNLTIFGDGTSDVHGDKLVSLHNAYNIEMEDVWIYNQKTSIGLSIEDCNDIVLSNLVVYGQDTGSSRKGVFLKNSTVKMISPDVENIYTGIYSAGGGTVDIISPYMERCIVGYRHAVTTGTTRIYGGLISSINGYCIDVQGDHLYVYGTDLAPYQGANPGGLGINSSTGEGYANVFFHDIPKVAQKDFFDRTTNWLNLHVTGTVPVPDYNKGTIDFSKELKNHTAVDAIEFNDVEYANCELRIYGPLNKSNYISKVYTFAVTEGSFSTVKERVEVNSGDIAVLTVIIKQINASRCKVIVKADVTGSLKRDTINLNLQLNYQAKTSNRSKLLLL